MRTTNRVIASEAVAGAGGRLTHVISCQNEMDMSQQRCMIISNSICNEINFTFSFMIKRIVDLICTNYADCLLWLITAFVGVWLINLICTPEGEGVQSKHALQT